MVPVTLLQRPPLSPPPWHITWSHSHSTNSAVLEESEASAPGPSFALACGFRDLAPRGPLSPEESSWVSVATREGQRRGAACSMLGRGQCHGGCAASRLGHSSPLSSLGRCSLGPAVLRGQDQKAADPVLPTRPRWSRCGDAAVHTQMLPIGKELEVHHGWRAERGERCQDTSGLPEGPAVGA